MVGLFSFILCLNCAAPVAIAAAADGTPVDVELVLAVDVSRSMDTEEFAQQRAGYAEALRHPDFLRAILTGANRRIALTYFEWASTVRGETVVPWQIIDSAESAEDFAAKLETRPSDTYRGTSISSALTFGTSLFEENGLDGWRHVIDVSGDGPNNIGVPVKMARDVAVSRGITVNGLPILIRPSTLVELDRYYAECVTGGPGSFVLPIHASSEFATAIRRKLILEVSGLVEAPVIRAEAEAPVDCEKGERDRRLYSDPYFPQLDK
jgi:hypothetical protein